MSTVRGRVSAEETSQDAGIVGCKEPTKIMPSVLLAVTGTVMEIVSAVTGKPPLLTPKFARTIAPKAGWPDIPACGQLDWV